MASIGASAAPVAPAALPEQEPGVTLRTFQLARSPGAVCELAEGTTPNVDKLMENIDWYTEEDFGLADDFITHALANLHVEESGEYEFRMTNDDGAQIGRASCRERVKSEEEEVRLKEKRIYR